MRRIITHLHANRDRAVAWACAACAAFALLVLPQLTEPTAPTIAASQHTTP